MSFAIQSGVPLPTRTGGGDPKYPLSLLEVGQSFFVPNAKKSVQVTLSKNAKRLGIAITTRVVSEPATEGGEAVKGLRVWRTEPKAAAAAPQA